MSEETDRKLIEAFLANSKEACDQLTQWIRAAIRAKPWIGSIDPKEVVQETLMRLVEAFRAGKFRFESLLKTYVQTIARNVLANYVRDEIRRRNYRNKQDPDPIDPRTPQEDLIDEETLRLAMRVLRLVTEECRKLCFMILWDELSHKEIAAGLGISEGASKTRWSRCVSRMKEIAAKIQ